MVFSCIIIALLGHMNRWKCRRTARTKIHKSRFEKTNPRLNQVHYHRFVNASRLNDEFLKCSQSQKAHKVLIYWTYAEENFCSNRRFLMNENSSSITALVSLPGSGNTWLRYMIEVASGIYTGSFYNDSKLIRKGWYLVIVTG